MLAEKELCFASLASNEIAAALVGLGAAITVALLDGGVYALVAAALANGTTSSLLAWWRLSRGYRPSWHLRFSEAKPYLRFGGYLVGENLAGTGKPIFSWAALS